MWGYVCACVCVCVPFGGELRGCARGLLRVGNDTDGWGPVLGAHGPSSVGVCMCVFVGGCVRGWGCVCVCVWGGGIGMSVNESVGGCRCLCVRT